MKQQLSGFFERHCYFVRESWNWLRVFSNAEASRMGHGVGPQRHTRAERSEKGWYSMAAYGVGMRVIAKFWPVRS